MQNTSLIKRIGFIALGVLIIIYVIFQLFYSNSSRIKTDTVTKTSSYDTYDTTGFVIRDEVLVDNNYGGAPVFTVDDGYAIASGGSVADIYESVDDATVQKQMSALQTEKSNLEQLEAGSDSFERDLDKLNSQIFGCINSIEKSSTGGNLNNISNTTQNLTYMLNERQLVKGNIIDFSSKIADIDSQISDLSSNNSQKIATIESPQAGYFISNPDGYENCIKYSDAKSVSVDDLHNSIQKQEVPSNAIGKISTQLNWYIACEIPADKVASYRLDDEVTLTLPYSSNMDIPAKIVAVNQVSKDDPAAIIFGCDYMNSDLAKARNEKVEIHSNQYTGLKVSKDAIHVNEITKDVTDENGNTHQETQEVQGAYILYGNQLVFKQIVPIYAYNSYVVCDENPDPATLLTDGTVKPFDKVVVGGSNLYDGKFVS